MIKIEIDSYEELIAIQRALLEFKEIHEPFDDAVLGSVYVARFANRVLDKLIDIDLVAQNMERVEQWRNWRAIDENRREWALIVFWVKKCEGWGKMNEQHKTEYILNIASPFKLTPEQLSELIDIGDSHHKT